MKEFLSIYGLKFIEWNADITKILKVFHIQNWSILKYNVCLSLQVPYFIPTYAYKGIEEIA